MCFVKLKQLQPIEHCYLCSMKNPLYIPCHASNPIFHFCLSTHRIALLLNNLCHILVVRIFPHYTLFLACVSSYVKSQQGSEVHDGVSLKNPETALQPMLLDAQSSRLE